MGRLEEYQGKRNQVRVLLCELLNEGHNAIEHCESLERKIKKYEQDNTKSENANAYENGLKEAWTLIQDVFYMQSCEAVKCFGEDNFEDVLQMDAKKAFQMYSEYMQKKEAEA